MKKQQLFKWLLLAVAVVWTLPSLAQFSRGGTPPSFASESKTEAKQAQLQKATKIPVTFDVQKLKAEDAEREAYGHPPRVGKVIPVKMSMDDEGQWTTLANGQRIWRLTIEAPGAIALMLTYDKFIIPEGGKLFIYNTDRSRVLGAYTEETNLKGEEFATEFINGDVITLEYVEPLRSKGQKAVLKKTNRPEIVISGVVYGYNHLYTEYTGDENRAKLQFSPSGSCQVNVNCPEGANWQNEKKGVVRIVTPTGGGYYSLCSGSVVNNTTGNLDPLFLSAFHCYEEMTAALLNQTIYYFHYEVEGCIGRSDPVVPTVVGATKLAESPLPGGSDGVLLRLNTTADILQSYEVYYNGWDRRNTAAARGVGIHHPAGDVKKISTFTAQATSVQANITGYGYGAAGGHWSVVFVATQSGHGTTEGGSSGSPLFNQDGRIVGTLTGGNSSCSSLNGTNLYGKLWYHFNQDPDPAAQMAKFLDPLGSGEEFIDGTYFVKSDTAVAVFFPSATDIYATQSVQFTDASILATTWEWQFSGGTPAQFTGKTPPAVLYSTPGNFEAKLTINKGTANEKIATHIIKVTQKEKVSTEEITIGTGTATAQFPLGIALRYTRSSAIYTADELGMDRGGIINQLAWNAGAAATKARTFYIYLKEVDDATLTPDTWEHEIDGATLVLTSTNTARNTAGWNTFALSTPFAYSGTKNLKVLVRMDGGTPGALANSNCAYTTVTDAHMEWESASSIPATTNGTVTANRPNIRFTAEVNYGTVPPVADFAIEGANKIEIFEGETVTFTDRSAGPPVSWQWTLPGAVPASSELTNVTATYPTAGTYDVTLKVVSGLGTDTKTVTGAVIVKPVPVVAPVAQFISDSYGFRTYPNSGQFLPLTGGEVYFEDVSENEPTSWLWTLPGATPASATEASFSVNYPASASTAYNAKLAVENSAGGDELEQTDYIQVGGTANIWNVYGNENPVYSYTSSGYGLTGADLFTQTSERFESTDAGLVSKVRVLTVNVGQSSPSYYMTVALYSDNGGVPGTLLSPTMGIPGGSIVNGGYNTITFPTTVAVPEVFHVVVGSTNYNYVYFTVPCVEDRGEDFPYSTVKAYYQSAWRDLGTLAGLYTSMHIIPEFVYTEFELTSDTIIKKKNIDPAPVTVSWTTNALSWTTETSQPWIHLSATSGTGTSSFDITVDNNPYSMRTGMVSLNVGGVVTEIPVVQTGTNPVNLTAAYDDDSKATALKWELTLPAYTPGDNIWEEVESLATFAIAPASTWVYPWTLYDGDTRNTYRAGTGNYTNSTTPKSFIVFSPAGTNVTMTAAVAAQYTTHNGGKVFASFASSVTATPTNDWLISPPLEFDQAFTLSFWAKSASTLTNGAAAYLRVVYSTTAGSTATANFTNVLTGGGATGEAVPLHWVKYEFSLPANARYVAINSVTPGGSNYTLLVDDIYLGTGVAARNDRAEASPDAALAVQGRDLAPKVAVDPSQKLVVDGLAERKGKAERHALKPILQKKAAQLSARAITQPATAKTETETRAGEGEDNLKVLRWDDGELYSAIGTSGGGNIEVAIRFTPSDLLSYKNATIKAVELAVRTVGANMVLNIRQGGQIVHTQPLSGLQAGSFNRITLTNDVVIDNTKELWVGYAFTQAAGQENYVPSADRGPAVAGKGDLIALDGGAFEALSSLGLNYNWNIAVYVLPGETSIAYNVYRGSVLIGEMIEEKTYQDANAAEGVNNCYTVTAVYDDDEELESLESNQACVTVKALLTLTAGNATRAEGALNPAFAATVTGNFLGTDNEALILPDVTFVSGGNIASPAGTYSIVPAVSSTSTLNTRYVFTAVPGVLTVTAFPTVITQQPAGTTLCTGDNYTFTVTATGLDVRYQWQKQDGAAWRNLGAEIITSGTSTNAAYTLNAITVADAGVYRVLVNGRSEKPESNEVTLRVGLPASQLIAYPWNDVPTVNNNPLFNGGYTFSAFQWYRDGAAISGAEKPYLQVPKGTTSTFAIDLTANAGLPLAVCPFVPQVSATSLSVYPNPVTQSARLTLQSSGLPEGSVANIYTSAGALVKGNQPVSGTESTIDVSGLTHGLYVLQVVQPDGTKQTINIVVN
jgi:PKD repeat protein